MIWLCLLDSSRAPPGLGKLCIFPGLQQSSSGSLDLTAVPHPRFLMQGHMLNVGGDALSQMEAQK
jgi:hypothetical protein